jgi:hypothetical protein
MPPPLTRVSRQLSIVVETGAPARSKGGGGIGRSGGGGLEQASSHARRWLGAQWAGLSPAGAPSWAELPGAR